MRRKNLDLSITAALAILVGLAAIARLPAGFMVVPGLALIAAPGFVWCEALLGPRVTGLERIVVTGALSLAVPVLGGLVLYAAGVSLSRVAWAGLLAQITLIGDLVVFMRRRAGRPHASVDVTTDRPVSSRPVTGRPESVRNVSRRTVASVSAALVVAGCAVGLAHAGAGRQQYPGFTQMWLVADKGGGRPGASPSGAGLGVTNQQAATRYHVVVLRSGYPPAQWDFVLQPGQSWRRTITFGSSNVIRANLFRLPDLTHIYRYVTISSNAGSP